MAEHSPLFEPGFHEIAVEDIDKLFVAPFNDCTRRQELTGKLKLFLNKLNDIDASFEVWIDGSFATKKITPGDIDIAIIFEPEEINNLPHNQLNFLQTDQEIIKIRYNLDVYYVPNDFQKKSYWKGLFGFSRAEQPKGIPRFYLGGEA